MGLFDSAISSIQTDWKDVVGYEGLYKVNRDGQVCRVGQQIKTRSGHYQTYPERILKPYDGVVELSKNGHKKTMHVCALVAQAFLDGYVIGQPIYHIDGSSDAVTNLSLTAPIVDDSSDWKDIPGYEGYYQASIDGSIRSVTRIINSENNTVRRGKGLKIHLGSDGYVHCMLSKQGQSNLYAVHRLVALTFIPNPENKPQVNHKDGNKKNNKVENLEWATRSENMQHAAKHELWNPKHCGDISRMNMGKPVRCVDEGLEFDSMASAAKYYQMDWQSIDDAIKLQRPRKGHMFELIEK